MNTQEITQTIVDTAKDQINLCGMAGAERARSLIYALSAIGLCGGVLPEEIEQARQQVEQEIADTEAEKPPKLAGWPDLEHREAVLEWLRQPWDGELLTEEGKKQIREAIEFLEDYWL